MLKDRGIKEVNIGDVSNNVFVEVRINGYNINLDYVKEMGVVIDGMCFGVR